MSKKIQLMTVDRRIVKDIESMRKEFTSEQIFQYYISGQLKKWLKERYYDELADELDGLDICQSNFTEKFCSILEIPHPAKKFEGNNMQIDKSADFPTVQEHNQDVEDQEPITIPVAVEIPKVDEEEPTQKNPSQLKKQEVTKSQVFVPDSSPSRTSILDFFSTKKRLNRKKYMLRFLTLCAFFIAITIVFAIIDTIMLQIPAFMPLAMLAASIIVWISFLMATICRLHDLGHSGWWCVIFFVPYVNIAFAIYLILFKGTNGRNKYGDDPLAMSTESN